MVRNSSSIEIECPELGVELIPCSSCSQYFEQLIHKEAGVLLFVSEMNITVRETILCAKQFSNCPFLIYLDTKDEREEQRLKQEVESLLEEYGLDKNKILVTEQDVTQQQLIEKLLLCANQEEVEEYPIEINRKDTTGGVRDCVKTYQKTRKPFSRKLDK